VGIKTNISKCHIPEALHNVTAGVQQKYKPGLKSQILKENLKSMVGYSLFTCKVTDKIDIHIDPTCTKNYNSNRRKFLNTK
jgi:hypothetical protein